MNPGHDLEQLKAKVAELATSSPNCAEFMSKYKSKDSSEAVKEIRIKWASEGRDKQLFPRETVLTDDNTEPILQMIKLGGSKDVLDVKMDVKQHMDSSKKQDS